MGSMQQSRLESAHSQTHDASTSKRCMNLGATWSRTFPIASSEADQPALTTTDTSKQMEHDSPSESEPTVMAHKLVTKGGCESTRRRDFVSCESWIADFWQKLPTEIKDNFEATATIQPPISASSLRELEIGCIMNNVRLRHDINFDRELHFRPNLEGERGREKMTRSTSYWKALETELQLYHYLLADPAGSKFRWGEEWITIFRQSQRRIPAMFEATKEILARLMPEQDQERLKETLDVVLIMQQIERGLFDLEKLAIWFAQLLKSHCAPMRDPWVDQMVEKTSNGAGLMDAPSIVEGLRELFGILEAMKLDVANHQIRYLRVMLLDNTVAFEQNYYKNKIETKQVDTENASAWYRQESQLYLPSESSKDSSISRKCLNPFVSALVTSVLPRCADVKTHLPETFKLDIDRLRMLNADCHGLIYHLICYEALEHILKYLKCSRENAEFAKANVGDIVRSVVGFPPFVDARWVGRHVNIALELVRLASCGSSSTSNEFADKLQHDQHLLSACEKAGLWLQYNLRPTSENFARQVISLQRTLFDRVLNTMESHVERNAVAAFEALVAHPRSQLTGSALYELVLQDITRRLSHIGVLHWQVWASLVYTKESPDATTSQSIATSLHSSTPVESSMTTTISEQGKESIMH